MALSEKAYFTVTFTAEATEATVPLDEPEAPSLNTNNPQECVPPSCVVTPGGGSDTDTDTDGGGGTDTGGGGDTDTGGDGGTDTGGSTEGEESTATNNIGREGEPLVLDIDVGGGPGIGNHTLVTVTLGTVPSDWQVVGAVYNPLTGEYSASADDWNNRLVSCIPPEHFCGEHDFTIDIETLSTSNRVSVSSGVQPLTVFFDPVASGVSAELQLSTAALEDGPLENASVSFAFTDTEGIYEWFGPVLFGQWFYMQFSSTQASFATAGYHVVQAGDDDATFLDGTSLVGYSRIPYADRDSFVVDLLANWHGSISGDIRTPVMEGDRFPQIGDGEDSDDFVLSRSTFTIVVSAVADYAILTVPSLAVQATEDQATLLVDSDGQGLSARLADEVAANGAEMLSVTLRGVPTGSRMSAGLLSGAGTWVIPVAALATLELTPPQHWAGVMDLSLHGLVYESSNGDYKENSAAFTVVVQAVANSFLIVARNVDVLTSPSGLVSSALEVRMVDDGTGEDAPEYVSVTLSDVPTGIRYLAGAGGRLTTTTGEASTWEFVGTAAQANALAVVTGPSTVSGYANNLVQVSVTGHDGSDAFGPVLDNYRLAIQQDDVTSLRISGGDGNDILVGDVGNDILVGGSGDDILVGGASHDLLVGGPGADSLTGGTGTNVFQWSLDDLDGSTDVITDFFVVGSQNVLDLSAVFLADGLAYNPQDFRLDSRLELSPTGTLTAKLTTGPVPVVSGLAGATLAGLWEDGSLLV
jgi:Ca2+-binding RTX toxin-like protein